MSLDHPKSHYSAFCALLFLLLMLLQLLSTYIYLHLFSREHGQLIKKNLYLGFSLIPIFKFHRINLMVLCGNSTK